VNAEGALWLRDMPRASAAVLAGGKFEKKPIGFEMTDAAAQFAAPLVQGHKRGAAPSVERDRLDRGERRTAHVRDDGVAGDLEEQPSIGLIGHPEITDSTHHKGHKGKDSLGVHCVHCGDQSARLVPSTAAM